MLNISDLKLERYAVRELPTAELLEIETRLKTDPALRERLKALEASNAAILRETPPELFAARLRALESRRAAEASVTDPARTASRSFGVWKPLLGSLALVLPLLALLALPTAIVGPRPASDAAPPATVTGASPAVAGTEGVGQGAPVASPREAAADPVPPPASPEVSSEDLSSALSSGDGIRLKGLEPHLAIFRKTDSGSEPLHPGEKARPGELLRIGYQAAGFPYGAILSVDGNGNVTRHWPSSGAKAGPLENGEALLPSSFELDSAPDYERFYFVVARQPFELDPLLESLHKNESLPDLGKIKTTREIRVVRFEVLKENGI